MKKVNRRFTLCGDRLCESRFFIAHPIVILFYFIGLLTLLFLYQNPIFTLTTLACILAVCITYAKPSELAPALKLGGLIALFITLINPLINHRGVTTLFTIWDIKITLESLCYGLLNGLTMMGLVLLFVPFNALIDTERFLYLFSRISPKIAFITGMTLRFIPTFSKRAQDINDTAAVRGISTKSGSLTKRLKSGQILLETLFNSSLEDGMGVATVLKTKEYGTTKRTAYINYRFSLCDGIVLFMMVAIIIWLVASGIGKNGDFSFFPRLKLPQLNSNELILYVGLAVYLLIPFVFEGVAKIKLMIRRGLR